MNDSVEILCVKSKIGLFIVELENETIIKSGFHKQDIILENEISSKVSEKLQKDLKDYFSGLPVSFEKYDVRINLSPFTTRVLKEVRKIPYGKTVTYKEIAERIGSKGYRAVGKALNINPIPVIIPCHRVVSVKNLGGYSTGLKMKRALLELEGAMVE